MKKLIVFLLIIISLVILQACSNNNEKNKDLGEITQNINTDLQISSKLKVELESRGYVVLTRANDESARVKNIYKRYST